VKYLSEYLALKALFSFFASRGKQERLDWGRRLGRAWFRIDGRHRSLAVDNISRALGLPLSKSLDVARANFEHIGETLAEFAAFTRFDEYVGEVSLDGLANLEKALEAGRGALLVSGHFGNWELIGGALSRKVPLSVVARPMKNPRTEALIRERREMAGARVIGHRNSSKEIIRRLAKGEVIAILLDQNTHHREAVFVPFLGRPAAVNFGAALIALKTGAPVIPGFSVREGGGRHRALIRPPVEFLPAPDRREEIGRNTARITAVLEGHVRRYPDQWFWVHNRWKNTPRAGDRIYAP
jgi:KDO2-lipid IV(A) lauroyltransferase